MTLLLRALTLGLADGLGENDTELALLSTTADG
jgi:hypothetical protein